METRTRKVTCDGCSKSFTQTIAEDGQPIGTLSEGEPFEPSSVHVQVGGVVLTDKKIACSPPCARVVLADVVERWPTLNFEIPKGGRKKPDPTPLPAGPRFTEGG